MLISTTNSFPLWNLLLKKKKKNWKKKKKCRLSCGKEHVVCLRKAATFVNPAIWVQRCDVALGLSHRAGAFLRPRAYKWWQRQSLMKWVPGVESGETQDWFRAFIAVKRFSASRLKETGGLFPWRYYRKSKEKKGIYFSGLLICFRSLPNSQFTILVMTS